MAPKNSAASKKAVKAGAKKASISKPGIKKTAKKTSIKGEKNLKTPIPSSKKTPAAAKKASTLTKVEAKTIKKTLEKKGKQVEIKGSAKKTLGGAAKASTGGVGAFDLEAFVKIKFSELERTAHQKKVSHVFLPQNHSCPPECVWTDQQHCGRAEQV